MRELLWLQCKLRRPAQLVTELLVKPWGCACGGCGSAPAAAHAEYGHIVPFLYQYQGPHCLLVLFVVVLDIHRCTACMQVASMSSGSSSSSPMSSMTWSDTDDESAISTGWQGKQVGRWSLSLTLVRCMAVLCFVAGEREDR
jgi:hypothetical protein